MHRQRERLLFGIAVLFMLSCPLSVVPLAEYITASQTEVEYTSASGISQELANRLSQSSSDDRLAIVVRFSDGSTADEMLESLWDAGIADIEIRHVFHRIPFVSLYAAGNSIQAIASSAGVQSVDTDHVRTIDSASVLDAFATSSDDMQYTPPNEILGADSLWSEGFNGTGVTVAVIDTGAQADHPDLDGRISGFVDLVNDETDAYDDNGHGTACAWLIAGSGQAMGGALTGMSPGADLLIVKVLDETGTGEDSVIAQGVEYAVENGADVISISLGGAWEDSEYVDPILAAVQDAVEAEVVVVVAAGNSGPGAETLNSPGVVLEVITVGASSGVAGVVSFSSRGPVVSENTDPVGVFAKPDLLAPGDDIISGRLTSSVAFEYPIYNQSQFGSNYTQWSGTSVSAPLIAGLAALLLDRHAGLSTLEVKTFLMAGATNLGQDPMAQGFGVANVSRSSELILDTSGIYTIAAPFRYPTLPDGPSVFIIGDDREPQDVTVLSTVNRNDVSIFVDGNASMFVNVSVDSLDLVAGYSYFKVGLDMPDDLPLSAVGHYTGWVNLVDDSEVVASVELDLWITAFGGRVLVDMSHQSSDDLDSPEYYKYFDDYIRQQGLTMTVFPNEYQSDTIDYGALSVADVLLIMDTELVYYDSEVSAIHEFVQNGGTLLMFSEAYSDDTQQAYFGIDSYNQILEPYGIECEKYEIGGGINAVTGVVYGADHGGVVENNTLMGGVRNLYVLAGSTLKVDSSVVGTKGLFWIDGVSQHAIVAVAESGKGKVIVVSDGSTMYDDSIYDSVILEADNLRLLRNIASYIVPASPSIYNVEFNRGEIGEAASVIAYVFDEGLDNVSIVVEGPDGNAVNGTMTEDLGYKFTKTFMMDTAGFYEIVVTATDSDGNEKTYRRSFLITVNTIDDGTMMGVIYVLLGVVALALGYVAVLKLGRGKNPKRDAKSEWEVPVTDGSDRSPAIE